MKTKTMMTMILSLHRCPSSQSLKRRKSWTPIAMLMFNRYDESSTDFEGKTLSLASIDTSIGTTSDGQKAQQKYQSFDSTGSDYAKHCPCSLLSVPTSGSTENKQSVFWTSSRGIRSVCSSWLAISNSLRSKKERHAIYSGKRTIRTTISSLQDLCLETLKENLEGKSSWPRHGSSFLFVLADVSHKHFYLLPYDVVKSVIEAASPEQLYHIVDNNPVGTMGDSPFAHSEVLFVRRKRTTRTRSNTSGSISVRCATKTRNEKNAKPTTNSIG